MEREKKKEEVKDLKQANLVRELVERARNKDVDAFTELYEGISKELYRTAYYCLKNQQDAEDVVSETVLAAWSQITALREPDAFRGWIFKILSNRCQARLKQYAKDPLELRGDMAELGQEEKNVSWVTAKNNADIAGRMDLRQALKKLVAADRMILTLSVLEGYTTKEVAQMLNMKHATVRSRKSRALEKLAEFLA